MLVLQPQMSIEPVGMSRQLHSLEEGREGRGRRAVGYERLGLSHMGTLLRSHMFTEQDIPVTSALYGYEPAMNIHSLIGNLKAGISCLGVKCCPLIGHLDTVKGGGAHALWAGLGAQPCGQETARARARTSIIRCAAMVQVLTSWSTHLCT